MVVVLGISLVFVDLLYLVKKVPEGFEPGVDVSGTDISGSNVSGTDISGSMYSDTTSMSSGTTSTSTNFTTLAEETQKTENPVFTISTFLKKLGEVLDNDGKQNIPNVPKLTDAVNPLVGVKDVLKEKLEGKSIEDVNKEAQDVKGMLKTVENTSPELHESLKSVNSIDIHEINKLINKLSEMTKNLKPEV